MYKHFIDYSKIQSSRFHSITYSFVHLPHFRLRSQMYALPIQKDLACIQESHFHRIIRYWGMRKRTEPLKKIDWANEIFKVEPLHILWMWDLLPSIFIYLFGAPKQQRNRLRLYTTTIAVDGCCLCSFHPKIQPKTLLFIVERESYPLGVCLWMG